MELESMPKFLENKTILVTDATGFLARAFVEKILRVQPDVKRLPILPLPHNACIRRYEPISLNYNPSFGITDRYHTPVRLHDSLSCKREEKPIEYAAMSSSLTCTTEHHKGKNNITAKNHGAFKDLCDSAESLVNAAAKERRSSPLAVKYTHKERPDEDYYVNTQSHNIMADCV